MKCVGIVLLFCFFGCINGEGIYVSLSGSNSSLSCFSTDPCVSVQQALQVGVNLNYTILELYMDNGRYTGESNVNLSLPDAAVTIQAWKGDPEVIFDGQNSFSYGFISTSFLTVQNITILGVRTCILVNEVKQPDLASLILNSVVLNGTNSIQSSNGNTSITNSTLQGLLYISNPDEYIASISLYQSTFLGINPGKTNYYFEVYFYGENTDIDISFCTFSDFNGFGINGNVVNMANLVVRNCYSSFYESSLYLKNGGDVIITDANITDTLSSFVTLIDVESGPSFMATNVYFNVDSTGLRITSERIFIDNCTFDSSDYGIVCYSVVEFNVTNSVFKNQRSGAIVANGAIFPAHFQVYIGHNQFYNNTGISISGPSFDMAYMIMVEYCDFHDVVGSAIFISSYGNIVLDNINLYSFIYYRDVALISVAGVSHTLYNLTFSNSHISNTSAPYHKGSLRISGFYAAHVINSTFANNDGFGGLSGDLCLYYFMENCVFENNNVTDNGGAIYLTNYFQYNMKNCSFIKNQAGYSGTDIFLLVADGSYEIFDQCSFQGIGDSNVESIFIGGGTNNMTINEVTFENYNNYNSIITCDVQEPWAILSLIYSSETAITVDQTSVNTLLGIEGCYVMGDIDDTSALNWLVIGGSVVAIIGIIVILTIGTVFYWKKMKRSSYVAIE